MKKIILGVTILAIVAIIGSFCNDHVIVRNERYIKGSMNGLNQVEMRRETFEGKLIGPRRMVRNEKCTIQMTLEQFLLSGDEWTSTTYEWR